MKLTGMGRTVLRLNFPQRLKIITYPIQNRIGCLPPRPFPRNNIGLLGFRSCQCSELILWLLPLVELWLHYRCYWENTSCKHISWHGMKSTSSHLNLGPGFTSFSSQVFFPIHHMSICLSLEKLYGRSTGTSGQVPGQGTAT